MIRLRAPGSIMTIDVILAPAFGTQGSKSNAAIGSWLAAHHDRFTYVLVQHEVGSVMARCGAVPDFQVDRHRRGTYLDTPEVISQMLAWLPVYRLNGIRVRVWVACHKTQWKACRYFLRKWYGIHARRVALDVPYDRHSGQWQTRGPLGAFFYKPVAIFRYLRNGDLQLFHRSPTKVG